MSINTALAAKIAANLQAQHQLIAELREMVSPDSGYNTSAVGSVNDVVWEFAYGDTAAFDEEHFTTRAQLAQAILDGKDKL
jgi:hypothetical protein